MGREEKKTKRRVAPGAEMITNRDVLEIISVKKEKHPRKTTANKNSKTKILESSTESETSEVSLNLEDDGEDETL